MSRPDSARAGLVLTAALFAAALPRPAPSPARCPAPHFQPDESGALMEVRCDGPTAGLEGAARLLFDLPIDVNRADAAALEALPAVGPVRARAILAERERQRFAVLEDLGRVPGIGPRTQERLRGKVWFGSAEDPPGLR